MLSFVRSLTYTVSKLSIKEIENNNSAREVKRSHIIFRFSFP
ncbi:AAA family ATPase, partial [Leptospira borgpetersenii]